MTAEPSMRAFTPLIRGDGWTSDGQTAARVLEFGPFKVSPTVRLLTRNGTAVPIGGRAFDLLLALLDRAGQVVGARQLHNLVWPDVTVEEANLRVCVATLRRALGEHTGEARYIVNVNGRGYSLVAPVTRAYYDTEMARSADELDSATPASASPPHLLISRNENIDVLSRLLVSGRFFRLTEAGDLAPPHVARALLALHDACGLDAACFALRAHQAQHLANARATSSSQPPRRAASGDEGVQETLAEAKLLIVVGRYQHLAATVTSLFQTLARVPSVHFLITGREAARGGFGPLPLFACHGDERPDAAAMIGALGEIGIATLPYHAWQAEFGRHRGDESHRLEELQRENERLRQAISDLTLEKLVLKQASFGHL